MAEYRIEAYPNGGKQVVSRFTAADVSVAIEKGFTQAKLRGEYVDVFRDGVCIATPGPDGRMAEDDGKDSKCGRCPDCGAPDGSYCKPGCGW